MSQLLSQEEYDERIATSTKYYAAEGLPDEPFHQQATSPHIVEFDHLSEADQVECKRAIMALIVPARPKDAASAERIFEAGLLDGRWGVARGGAVAIRLAALDGDGRAIKAWHTDPDAFAAYLDVNRNPEEAIRRQARERAQAAAADRAIEHRARFLADEAQRKADHIEALADMWRTWAEKAPEVRAMLRLASKTDAAPVKTMLAALARTVAEEYATLGRMQDWERQQEQMPEFARELLGLDPFESREYAPEVFFKKEN